MGIQHDVGIFELPDGRRYLIAMFTGDLENDSAGIAAISQVSLGGVSGPSGLTAALCALCGAPPERAALLFSLPS